MSGPNKPEPPFPSTQWTTNMAILDFTSHSTHTFPPSQASTLTCSLTHCIYINLFL